MMAFKAVAAGGLGRCYGSVVVAVGYGLQTVISPVVSIRGLLEMDNKSFCCPSKMLGSIVGIF